MHGHRRVPADANRGNTEGYRVRRSTGKRNGMSRTKATPLRDEVLVTRVRDDDVYLGYVIDPRQRQCSRTSLHV